MYAMIWMSLPAQAQKTKYTTLTFWVGGVCEMCEERIERTVDVKGVRYADYDLDHHELKITFNPALISEKQIHELLNHNGHDTSMSKASDEAYERVHHCCRYREHHHGHDDDDHKEEHK
jgi:hypothetical protein